MVAPPRPTRRWFDSEVSIVHAEYWFDADLAERRTSTVDVEGRLLENEIPKQVRKASKKWQVAFWTLTLDDPVVYQDCLEVDEGIRRDHDTGHWTHAQLWTRIDGQRVRTHLVAWLMEYGDITAATMLRRTCPNTRCISPYHHKEK